MRTGMLFGRELDGAALHRSEESSTKRTRGFSRRAAFERRRPMNLSRTTQFKAEALSWETLQYRAPSIFAATPMLGVSDRYTFVPTARIVSGLREMDWVAVDVEEQRIRQEKRRGFQKHLIRFRLAGQIASLDEWNVELVLVNSHDAGCAYQLHAGIHRRICSNGLVVSDGGFEALRFRHAGLTPDVVVTASLRLLEEMPRLGGRIDLFRGRTMEPSECLAFAERAIRLRYPADVEAPISPATLLEARRLEDEGSDLWHTLNRCQENLIRGGVADGHRDRHGRIRSVRGLRGIDSKVDLNKGVWSLAERFANGEPLSDSSAVSVTA